MILLTLALLAQTAPPPPPAPSDAAPPVATAPPADEPAQVHHFADFVDRHLISLDPDLGKAAIGLRQGERTFSIKDDDFVQAFSLVPEAQAMARKAQEDLRTSTLLQIGALVAVAAGSAALVMVPLLGAGLMIPLLIAGAVLDLAGVVLLIVGLPFALSANTEFIKALSAYNHGLLKLRPGDSDGGGLTIPMP